jgi:hypothetical protein
MILLITTISLTRNFFFFNHSVRRQHYFNINFITYISLLLVTSTLFYSNLLLLKPKRELFKKSPCRTLPSIFKSYFLFHLSCGCFSTLNLCRSCVLLCSLKNTQFYHYKEITDEMNVIASFDFFTYQKEKYLINIQYAS